MRKVTAKSVVETVRETNLKNSCFNEHFPFSLFCYLNINHRRQMTNLGYHLSKYSYQAEQPPDHNLVRRSQIERKRHLSL